MAARKAKQDPEYLERMPDNVPMIGEYLARAARMEAQLLELRAQIKADMAKRGEKSGH